MLHPELEEEAMVMQHPVLGEEATGVLHHEEATVGLHAVLLEKGKSRIPKVSGIFVRDTYLRQPRQKKSSVEQPVGQPVEQLVERAAESPVECPVHQCPVVHTVEQPAERTVGRSA